MPSLSGHRSAARSCTGRICRLTTEPSLRFSTSIRCCVRKAVPTGMTMRPPGLSCFTSGGGTWLARGGDDDGVEGGVLGPPVVAVADFHLDLAVGEAFEALGSRPAERFDDLDAEHRLGRARRARPLGNPSRCRSPARCRPPPPASGRSSLRRCTAERWSGRGRSARDGSRTRTAAAPRERTGDAPLSPSPKARARSVRASGLLRRKDGGALDRPQHLAARRFVIVGRARPSVMRDGGNSQDHHCQPPKPGGTSRRAAYPHGCELSAWNFRGLRWLHERQAGVARHRRRATRASSRFPAELRRFRFDQQRGRPDPPQTGRRRRRVTSSTSPRTSCETLATLGATTAMQ